MTRNDHAFLLELLRACYDTAPEPLYPAPFAAARGIDRAVLDAAMDELRHRGLVRFTDWIAGRGQGYTLTQEGLELLEKNERGALAERPLPTYRPRVPEPYTDAEPAPRQELLYRGRGLVWKTLIAINIVVFILTERGLTPSPELSLRIQQYGVLTTSAVIQEHQWWRLLSYAFLHAGLLHIFFNMYFLYSLGWLLEAMWGPTRLLLLYLVAAITGGCVVVWVHRLNPENMRDIPTVGASGALCGLLASLGIWTMLNRDYLRPDVAQSLIRNVTVNLLFIGIMSFMIPQVSWEGHLGGAVGGALASFPLQWARYGESWQHRILGLLGTLLVAAVFVMLVFAQSLGLRPVG
jgi:rhomboid protease GluP